MLLDGHAFAASGLDRLDDLLVAGAAADDAADRLADRLLVGAAPGCVAEELLGGQQHRRRAEPALQAVVLA